MQKLQDKIDIMADIITKSKLSSGQKKYCAEVVQSLCNNIEIQKLKILKCRRAKFGLQNKEAVDDYVNKHIAAVWLCGSKYSLENLNPDSYFFMVTHKEQLKKPITINSIERTAKAFNLYKQLNDKEPNDMNELKNFIKEITKYA